MTLNQMVMFGMVLAVGILVDDGIVVVEDADRKMAEGMPKEQALAAAGKRMFWPVVNGTLTTLAAFLPFMFWDSISGKMMSFLPLTLFFVLGASIFVALIFTPAVGSIFGRATAVDAAHLAEIEKSEHGDPREMKGFMGWYACPRLFLPGRAPGPHGGRDAGDGRRHRRLVRPHAAPGRVLHRPGSREGHRLRQGARQPLARGAGWTDAPGGRVAWAVSSAASSRCTSAPAAGSPSARSTSPPNDSVGRIEVQFHNYEQRKELGMSGEDVANEIRERVADPPGMQVEVREPEGGPPIGKSVQVQLDSCRPGRAR